MINVDNGWYARGEFPPAGTDCEFWDYGWHLARIIGMDEEGLCVASVHFDEFRGYHSSAQIADFRPLKTDAERDRDAAIEEMLTFSPYPSSRIIREAYEALYDAGYRKPVNVTTTGLCPVLGLYDDDDHASVKGTQ